MLLLSHINGCSSALSFHTCIIATHLLPCCSTIFVILVYVLYVFYVSPPDCRTVRFRGDNTTTMNSSTRTSTQWLTSRAGACCGSWSRSTRKSSSAYVIKNNNNDTNSNNNNNNKCFGNSIELGSHTANRGLQQYAYKVRGNAIRRHVIHTNFTVETLTHRRTGRGGRGQLPPPPPEFGQCVDNNCGQRVEIIRAKHNRCLKTRI